jgi:hypothetical protein
VFTIGQEITPNEMLLDQGKAELPHKLDTFLKQAEEAEDEGRITRDETTSWRQNLLPVIALLLAKEELTPEQDDLVVRVMRLARWRAKEADERRWFRGDLDLADLEGVLIGDYWPKKEWSPPPAPRTLGEFARHPDPKACPKTIKGAFDIKEMRGCPIYMADTMDALVNGPWIFREGVNRSCSIVRDLAAGLHRDRTTFPVIIGAPRV